jgi:hypothetical protein
VLSNPSIHLSIQAKLFHHDPRARYKGRRDGESSLATRLTLFCYRSPATACSNGIWELYVLGGARKQRLYRCYGPYRRR